MAMPIDRFHTSTNALQVLTEINDMVVEAKRLLLLRDPESIKAARDQCALIRSSALEAQANLDFELTGGIPQ